MFESVQEENQTRNNRFGIAMALVAVLIVAGVVVYTLSSRPANAPASAAAPATAPAVGGATAKGDPIHDLKILRAAMDKDSMGTTAVWSLQIENRSKAYTYSDIQYETTYVGADSKPLVVNTGKIPLSLGPGDEKSYDLRDALYPPGTAWYKFRITGATSSTQ